MHHYSDSHLSDLGERAACLLINVKATSMFARRRGETSSAGGASMTVSIHPLAGTCSRVMDKDPACTECVASSRIVCFTPHRLLVM